MLKNDQVVLTGHSLAGLSMVWGLGWMLADPDQHCTLPFCSTGKPD